MKSYKDKQYLVFEFEDGKNVKYNLATGESIGKSGRPVKDVCTQLRGYSLLDVIDSFEDEKYRKFLKFVDSKVNESINTGWGRVDKIRNIGTFLKRIKDYAIFEQYFASGLTNVSDSLRYKTTEIPRGLLKLIRQDNLKITNGLIESYVANPDLFTNIYNLEGLHTLGKRERYGFANSIQYFGKEQKPWLSTDKKRFIELVEEYGYNPIALIKYVDTLMTLEALVGADKILTEVFDYARMMSRISQKYNKYPRNFLTTHKIASRNYLRLKEVFKEEDFKKRYSEHLNFEYEDYVIICPESTQAVKDEAVQQNHCVASYIQDVIDGKCNILFMREKENPTKSLITIELRGTTVIQARGKFNRDMTKEEEEVIKKYEERLERIMKKMIKVGDKIKLKKAICVLGDRFVGTHFTVTSVDDKYIYFKSSAGAGGIGYNDFKEHFEVVKETEEIKGKQKTEEVKTKVEVQKEDKLTLKARLVSLFKKK